MGSTICCTRNIDVEAVDFETERRMIEDHNDFSLNLLKVLKGSGLGLGLG